jgi:hypothetical protein
LNEEPIRVVKVKIDSSLFDRAKHASAAAGYSSVEEFIANCIEKELERLKLEETEAENEREVADRLRGLGYIE